jgi:hypothetical protein
MQEIENVKRAMAKFTIPCSVQSVTAQSVTAALLVPEELTEEQLHQFPKSGARLLENEWSTVGKKKKGKKGKKGKRGKKGKKRR